MNKRRSAQRCRGTQMSKYKPGDDVGPLEFWPFDAPESDYVITRGAPKTYGRIDAGGPGHTTRYGIWRCTEGAFGCTEQGDELMTVVLLKILEHRCVLLLPLPLPSPPLSSLSHQHPQRGAIMSICSERPDGSISVNTCRKNFHSECLQ